MFWGEAVLYVVYINNRSISIVLQRKTPYEMWHGYLPSVKHFRVFGCTCYALIPTQLRNKLEARSRKCIFLGYSTTSKAHRLYDKENNFYFISRDIILLEFDKDEHSIDKQLSHHDRFQSKKFYHEWDNELPTLDGVVPFLGQCLEVIKNEDNMKENNYKESEIVCEEPIEREDNNSKKI